jgi:hypothetical protein
VACYVGVVDPHRLAELRSIALHEAIGTEIVRRPELVEAARQRVHSSSAEGKLAPAHRDAWLRILDRPIEDVVAFLREDSEEARELRQATPFTGIIGARQRWSIWRAVREVA